MRTITPTSLQKIALPDEQVVFVSAKAPHHRQMGFFHGDLFLVLFCRG